MNETAYERWKNFHLALPDAVFYEVVRNYLGPIKSPYNKHSLLEQLSNFIDRREFAEKSLALLDDNDRALLSALYLKRNTTDAALSHLFTDWKQEVLQARLRSLQERLWIYRDRKNEDYRITPFLMRNLDRINFSPAHLIPQAQASGSSSSLPWFGENFMLALRSFLESDRKWFKQDGEATIRILQLFPERFALPNKDYENIVGTLRTILITLDLAFFREGEWQICAEGWNNLAALPDQDRIFLLAAAAAGSRQRLSDLALVLRDSVFSLPPGRGYIRSSWYRSWNLYNRQPEELSPELQEKMWRALTLLDLMEEKDDGIFIPSMGLNRDFLCSRSDHGIHLQPTGEITVSPQSDFSQALVIAGISRLVKADVLLHFELDKTSYFSAGKAGLSHEEIMGVLSSITGGMIPQNLEFQLNQWSQERNAVRVSKGILLEVSESCSRMMDQTGYFDSFVIKRINEQTFFMESSTYSLWSDLLRRQGAGYIPDFPGKNEKDSLTITPPAGMPSFAGISTPMDLTTGPIGSESPQFQEEDWKAVFNELDLDDEEKNEWQNRINRRIVLFPGQIRKNHIKRRKREAKAMDNSGKLLLIDHCLENRSWNLIITALDAEAKIRDFEVRPQKVDKNGNDHILYGRLLPEYGDFVMRVRKMSRVRMYNTGFI